MNPEQWRELKELFDVAADQAPEQRVTFLAQLRARDNELADELARLLSAHEAKTVAIDRPAFNGHHLIDEDPHLLQPGEVIMRRFRIVRCIGRGGMGEVYQADDRHMGQVAIKIIRPEIVFRENALARFQAEAKAARSITTPYVCRIHEFLTAPAENGRPEMALFTMELLDGCTLWDRIKQQGPFSRQEAETFAVQLCLGLQAIHDAGVIHRDLKARNIMLVKRRSSLCPVIMDFGLARHLARADDPALSFTEAGAVVGTPQYMAPEQFEGREVTRTADIYALGIVLYEMIVGQHPFDAATPLGAAIRRAKRPPSACSLHPEFPRRWDRVIERCLAYEPDRRYQSATEVAQAISQRAPDLSDFTKLGDTSRRSPLTWMALLALFACAAGLVVFWPNGTRAHPAEAVRWFNEGLAALRNGTYLKATHLFQQALKYDSSYALAHARLADAWSELDFQGKAEHEMVLASASDAAAGLSGNDRDYLEAIRSKVTGDFTNAGLRYERILKRLPAAEKAFGYLDLGRVYEEKGDSKKAIEDYSQAARAASDLPGPHLRLAVLESRKGDSVAAERDFAKSRELYEARIDDEGVAEVDYQLGVAATVMNQLDKARDFETKSLEAAKRMGSPQLETRALTRLAVIAYMQDDNKQCINLANQAIELARNNNLRYWDVEARVRLANAYVDQLDFAKAEPYLQSALQAAEEGQLPRLEALADWGLAVSRDLQQKPDETIGYAKPALAFYSSHAFFHEALSARLLIARAQEQSGNFKESLQSSLSLLADAKRSGDPIVGQAEEAVGKSQLQLGELPAALESFRSALSDLNGQSAEQADFQSMHCADVLWRLGRFREAEEILKRLSTHGQSQATLKYDVARIESEMNLSRQDYRRALSFGQAAEAAARDASSSNLAEIWSLLGLIQSRLGSADAAKELYVRTSSLLKERSNRPGLAEIQMYQATILFEQGNLSESKVLALEALHFFEESGQRELEWQALLLLSETEKRAGDSGWAKRLALQALDILSALKRRWGSLIFAPYASRPDVQRACKEAQLISGGKLA